MQAATTASADFSLRFITVTLSGTNEISPGKNAILIRTTAKSTPPILDHKSFASMCMLALIGTASYLVFVHRLTDSLHTSSPRLVTLTQLYFPLLAVVSSQEDFHLQDHAHAGRTHSLQHKCRRFSASDTPKGRAPYATSRDLISCFNERSDCTGSLCPMRAAPFSGQAKRESRHGNPTDQKD